MNTHNTEIAIKALNAYAEAARKDAISLDGEEIPVSYTHLTLPTKA